MRIGADRHHHLAAVDDGRKREGGQVGAVDHIDRNAGVARAHRNLFVALVAGRAHHRDRAGKTCRQRIVEIDLEMARTGGGLHDLVANVGMTRIPAHGGVRREQEPKLGDGLLAGADQRHRAAGHIEEYRKKTHRRLSLRTARIWAYIKRNSTGRFRFRNEKNGLS